MGHPVLAPGQQSPAGGGPPNSARISAAQLIARYEEQTLGKNRLAPEIVVGAGAGGQPKVSCAHSRGGDLPVPQERLSGRPEEPAHESDGNGRIIQQTPFNPGPKADENEVGWEGWPCFFRGWPVP